jgi:3-dehydroquinate dehydratase/shikimate dehydrogenase
MSFGKFLKLNIRGASHAKKMSFSLENFPSGMKIDKRLFASIMERRAPGRGKLTTARREEDAVVWKSGITSDGVTSGKTIKGEIANNDARPTDYGASRTVPRPGHADFGQWVETGRIPTGGGKNSGRLTAPFCAAGALCLQYLKERGISVSATVESIHGEKNPKEMIREVEEARRKGDSVGGIVKCEVKGICPGVGGALEEGIESSLSAALFAIPGVKAVEFGEGFDDARNRMGSEANDSFAVKNGIVTTLSNRQGGILGGRTNGNSIVLRLAMRPTPTVYVEQKSVDLSTMRPAALSMKGRHDPCIVFRALPVVESLVSFALADVILADEAAHPRICLTLTGKTLKENISLFKKQCYFTDMVEVRADLLDVDELKRVASFPKMLASVVPWKVPAILTFRRACDGGAYKGRESQRLVFFKDLFRQVRGKETFAYVDLEEGFGDLSLVEEARSAGIKVIRSLHKFDGPLRNIKRVLRNLSNEGDVAKVAFMPRSLKDVSCLFAEMKGAKEKDYIVLAMGNVGFATRALAGRLGSKWTYASCGGLGEIGHITPHELVRDYNFRTATPNAALYGVTGGPLLKTRSPEINNAAFAAEDYDAVMVPMPAKSAKEALAFMKAMNMQGMAVTIPHKFSIMPLLDRVSPFARKVGAVNTVVKKGGSYIGHNTDVLGFEEAFLAFAGDLTDKKVALLGDGGAAQAVKVALSRLGVKFDVFHRTQPKRGYDILVNATPVDPIPDYVFTGRELVYDLGYVPEITPLMARSAAVGCKVENGFSMLISQARAQRSEYEKARVNL